MVLFCVQCCVCRKRQSSPRCRSELIDSAWVVIVPGQKCIKKSISYILNVCVCVVSLSQTNSRDLTYPSVTVLSMYLRLTKVERRKAIGIPLSQCARLTISQKFINCSISELNIKKSMTMVIITCVHNKNRFHKDQHYLVPTIGVIYK